MRTATQAYHRTDVKDRFRAVHERLGDEDQLLLVFRIDRSLPWRDIAVALSGDADLDDEAITRESARLSEASIVLPVFVPAVAPQACHRELVLGLRTRNAEQSESVVDRTDVPSSRRKDCSAGLPDGG